MWITLYVPSAHFALPSLFLSSDNQYSIYNGIFFVGLVLFYFPDSHILRKGSMNRGDVLKRIDYIGALLSITGIILL